MCKTNSWENLSTIISDNSISITGRRSDGERVKVYASFLPTENSLSVVRKIKSLIDLLESQRNRKDPPKEASITNSQPINLGE